MLIKTHHFNRPRPGLLLISLSLYIYIYAQGYEWHINLRGEGDHGNGQSCLNEDDVDEVALIQGLVKRDLVLETAKTSLLGGDSKECWS